MDFLLTNDDGVGAPGIWAAARVMAEFGSVVMVAPANNCSGYGAAFPPGQTPHYFPFHDGDQHLAGVTAYGLEATPATCAHAGLSGAFGAGSFDLVVSGINWGANMGRDVFYSGTVGAALTAQIMGVPAIAISLDAEAHDVPRWDAAEWALRETVKTWLHQRDGDPLVFNVNVPNRTASELVGLQLTTFSAHSFLNRTRFIQDPALPRQLTVLRDLPPVEPEAWTDAWAVARGYASVTPVQPLPDLMCVMPWLNVAATAPELATACPHEIEGAGMWERRITA